MLGPVFADEAGALVVVVGRIAVVVDVAPCLVEVALGEQEVSRAADAVKATTNCRSILTIPLTLENPSSLTGSEISRESYRTLESLRACRLA